MVKTLCIPAFEDEKAASLGTLSRDGDTERGNVEHGGGGCNLEHGEEGQAEVACEVQREEGTGDTCRQGTRVSRGHVSDTPPEYVTVKAC